jgi:hypothetical protein
VLNPHLQPVKLLGTYGHHKSFLELVNAYSKIQITYYIRKYIYKYYKNRGFVAVPIENHNARQKQPAQIHKMRLSTSPKSNQTNFGFLRQQYHILSTSGKILHKLAIAFVKKKSRKFSVNLDTFEFCPISKTAY